MIRIIVIDDGVSCEQLDLPALAVDLCVTENGRITPAAAPEDAFTHGSICAAIIGHYLKKYQVSFELGSICVINPQTKRGKIERLLTALDWCETQPPCILHMSNGSELQRDEALIHGRMKRLYEKGFVIVSARSNHRGVSYPACFPEVVGVRTLPFLTDDSCRPNPTPWDGVDYLASGIHALSLRSGESYTTFACNSYAAPLVTARIAAGRLPKKERNAEIIGFGEHIFPVDKECPLIAITGDKTHLLEFTAAFYKAWLDDYYQAAVCNDTELPSEEGWYRWKRSGYDGMIRQLGLELLLVVTMQPQDTAAEYVITLVQGAECSFGEEAAILPSEQAAAWSERLKTYILSISETVESASQSGA